MIQLAKDLIVTADEYQYIVGKPIARLRNGVQSVEVKNPRYFTDMGQVLKYALSYAMRSKVADGSIATLHQFIEEQERLKLEI